MGFFVGLLDGICFGSSRDCTCLTQSFVATPFRFRLADVGTLLTAKCSIFVGCCDGVKGHIFPDRYVASNRSEPILQFFEKVWVKRRIIFRNCLYNIDSVNN